MNEFCNKKLVLDSKKTVGVAHVRGGGGGASMCRSGVRGANYGKVKGGQVWVGRGGGKYGFSDF